jgi:hypothetical protein
MLHRNRNACTMHGVNPQHHPVLADIRPPNEWVVPSDDAAHDHVGEDGTPQQG